MTAGGRPRQSASPANGLCGSTISNNPASPAFQDRSLSRHSVLHKAVCHAGVVAYDQPVPKLWNDTIEDHRRAVREATITATAELVTERGLSGVTMTGIAEKTGIGRATLYKYFPDVEAILIAWHERQISDHLAHLAKVADRTEDPEARLTAVLKAFAMITQHSNDTDLATQLHRGQHIAQAEHHLHHF